ncbi:unnamed protein product [Linum trigynum]|uniref:Uncharacterized protein n=1 Tax=Linum trigynum TaxID=586398 RepID=A0AAV2EJ77_9ROSI
MGNSATLIWDVNEALLSEKGIPSPNGCGADGFSDCLPPSPVTLFVCYSTMLASLAFASLSMPFCLSLENWKWILLLPLAHFFSKSRL